MSDYPNDYPDIVCQGCGVKLIVRLAPPQGYSYIHDLADARVNVPVAVVVLSRSGPVRTDTGEIYEVVLPGGKRLPVSERPQACSHTCLATIKKTWARSPAISLTPYSAVDLIDDEWCVFMWGAGRRLPVRGPTMRKRKKGWWYAPEHEALRRVSLGLPPKTS